MRPSNEEEACELVRRALALATGEELRVSARPDRERRTTEEVEEIWSSPSRRFAVEHTLLESFTGQLADGAAFERLVAPIEAALSGRLPGTFTLTFDVGAAAAVRAHYKAVQSEIVDAVLAAASNLETGSTAHLEFRAIAGIVALHRRRTDGSKLVVRRAIGDVEEARLDRVRTALGKKCPKLAVARAEVDCSVLILESDDLILANFYLVATAVQTAVGERHDAPDLVVVIETDIRPFQAWVVRNTTDIPLRFGFPGSVT